MKLTNLKVKDLFTQDEKITFLVGAGCSIDPPSNLPSGIEMMDKIIKYACAESEIDKILDKKELRFEKLVEIIRDTIDSELKIIDYYGESDKPNIQHFFLADMIIKGNFVITTNFDFLIEYALIHLKVPKNEICPVITENDFKEFNRPNALVKQGKKLVIKIHGSTKNIITEEETKNSLVTTIQAFGSNKKGMNVFQIEPYKRDLIESITNGHSLFILGYSGSDDFDIVPTLKILKNLRKIVWFNFKKIDVGLERIYQFKRNKTYNIKRLTKIDQILAEILQINNNLLVYRVDVNVSKMLRKLLKKEIQLNKIPFSITPYKWFKNSIKAPNKFMKYFISFKIYFELDDFDNALRCGNTALDISNEKNDLIGKALVLNQIGIIYLKRGKYSKALSLFEESLQINKNVKNLITTAKILSNIGDIYNIQGKYSLAIKVYKQVLKYCSQLNLDIPETLNNLGKIFKNQGNYVLALEKFEKALSIVEEKGELTGKASILNSIAEIYFLRGMYNIAIPMIEEALQICELLGDLSGVASKLNSIAIIFRNQGNLSKTLENLKKSFKIYDQLNFQSDKTKILINIGQVYHLKGEYKKALNYYKNTLKVCEELGDVRLKSICLNSIGMISSSRKNYPYALLLFEESLRIREKLNDLKGKADIFHNISIIHMHQKNFPLAIEYCTNAHEIAESLDIPALKAVSLNNRGMIYNLERNYLDALDCFNRAVQIDEEFGNIIEKAAHMNNIAATYLNLRNFPEALRFGKSALRILSQIGLGKSPTANLYQKNINFVKNLMRNS